MKVISLQELSNIPITLEYLRPIKVKPKLFVDDYYYPDTPYGHFLYAISGNANYIYKSSATEIRPGALYYIPTGIDPYFSEDEEYEYIKIYFRLIAQENGEEIILSDSILQLLPKISESMRQELFSMCYAFSADTPPVFRQYSLFFSFMESIYIEREREAKLSSARSASAISPALVHIQNNFQYSFSSKELADMCSLSESYFRRLFRETMHTSPTEYRNFLRINYSCGMLRSNEYTVSRISDIAGFENITHFYRVFKHFIGISPTEYRKRTAVKNSSKIEEHKFE